MNNTVLWCLLTAFVCEILNFIIVLKSERNHKAEVKLLKDEIERQGQTIDSFFAQVVENVKDIEQKKAEEELDDNAIEGSIDHRTQPLEPGQLEQERFN